MRVLVCGDRNWMAYGVIKDRLAKLPAGTVIVEGDCRGADRMAGIAAEALGFQVEDYRADWENSGARAGPLRNQRMLDEGCPDLVLAFHQNLATSSGTKDMVQRARKAGIPVEVIGESSR